jgi:tetratricopeptide (TPR) repeat protein
VPEQHVRHYLNVRGLLCLIAAGLVAGLGLYFLWGYQKERFLAEGLRQIKAFQEAGGKAETPDARQENYDLALRHLSQYLDFSPDDPEALEIEAQIRDGRRDVAGTIATYEHLLRVVKADDPRAKQAHLRLAALYIQMSDYYRSIAQKQHETEEVGKLMRYYAAELRLIQVLEGNAKANPPVQDALAHRLLAMALEGQIVPDNKTARSVEIPVEGIHGKTLEEAATLEYQKALALAPGDAIAAQRLANIYQRSNETLKARSVLTSLLKAGADNVEVRLIRFQFFRNHADPRAAADELEAAAKLDPENLGVILVAAENALRTDADGPRAARRWLARVPERWREDPRVLTTQGLVEYTERDFEAAIKTWGRGRDHTHGTDVGLAQRLAMTLLELHRDDEAAKLVGEYRRLAGDDDPVYRFLEGIQDEHAGRFSRAVERLESARSRLPATYQTSLHLLLGHCQEKQGSTAEAEKTYRSGIQLDPRSAALRQALGQLLFATAPEESVKELERGLESSPDQPALLVTLAAVRLEQQRARPAERRDWTEFDAAFKKALAAAPKETSLILMRAERLAADGGPDQAITFLTEVIEQDPRSVEVATRLSEYLLGQGRADQALQVLAKASDPKAAGDRGALRTQQALVQISLGRAREARSMLVERVDRLPEGDRDEVWRFLVLLCKSQGDPVTSRSTFGEWARLLPDDPRPKLALLEMDIQANDRDAIRARLESIRPRDERDDFTWRLAQARERLWRRANVETAAGPGRTPTEKSRRELLREADQLVESVLRDIKIDPVALLLKGQILEEEGTEDKAVEPYRQAWARGNAEALIRLVDLLVRLGRKTELERLRQSDPTKQLDHIEASTFLHYGDKQEASRIIQQSLTDRPGRQAWQVGMLDMIGETDKAEVALRAAAERLNTVEAWLVLLHFQTDHGERRSSADTIREIKRRFKSEQPELLEARCQWAAGNWPAADRAFHEAARRYANILDVQSRAARYFEERGRGDQAELCLRRILERTPNDRAIKRQLAIVLTAQTFRPDAWKQALDLLGPERSEGDAPEDRLARAVILGQSGDSQRVAQARELLEALVADVTTDSRVGLSARETLARLLLEADQPERASQVLEVLASTRDEPALIALYSEALLQGEKFSALEAPLKRLAGTSEGRPFEARLRARLIQKQAPSGEAATALEEGYLAREKAPGSELFGREAFSILLSMGTEALGHAERLGRRLAARNPALSWMPARILAIRGDNPGALDLCVAAARAQGELPDAVEPGRLALEIAVASHFDAAILKKAEAVFVAALAHAPDVDELLVMKAMLDHLQGHFAEEVRLYRLVLERKPRNPLVLNNIAWALCEGIHQLSEALAKIEEVIQLEGRNPNNADTRGVILMRMGQHSQAIEDLKWVVQAEPTGVHLYHLAHAYHEAGRDADFRATLDQMRRVGLTEADLDSSERGDYHALVGP